MHDLQADKAVEYRRQADEIRTVARQISLNEPRNKLLDAAGHLEALARQEESRAREASIRLDPRSEA
jgi:hypothetical protein